MALTHSASYTEYVRPYRLRELESITYATLGGNGIHNAQPNAGTDGTAVYIRICEYLLEMHTPY